MAKSKAIISRRTIVTLRSEGYEVGVDGKILSTPENRSLIIPTVELAEAIANEWDVYLFEHIVRTQNGRPTLFQTEDQDKTPLVEVYSYNMLPPLTRLAALAVDRIQNNPEYYIGEILNMLRSDMLLPHHVRLQGHQIDNELYNHLLIWFESYYNISLRDPMAHGKVLALHSVQQDLMNRNYWGLAAVHRLVMSLKSAILALGCIHGKISMPAVFKFLEFLENTPDKTQLPLAQRRLHVRTELIVVERFVTLSKCWDTVPGKTAPSTLPLGSIVKNTHEGVALRFELQ